MVADDLAKHGTTVGTSGIRKNDAEEAQGGLPEEEDRAKRAGSLRSDPKPNPVENFKPFFRAAECATEERVLSSATAVAVAALLLAALLRAGSRKQGSCCLPPLACGSGWILDGSR